MATGKAKIVKVIIIALCLAMLCAVSVSAGELICDYCQKEIINSEYFSLNGKQFHAGHLFCNHCGKSIKSEFNISGDEYYHKKCYDKYIALRCDLCGELINGRYVVDYWGNRVHGSHKDDGEPECEYCGRFIGAEMSESGYKLSDDRVICGICNKTAVNKIMSAQELMIEVWGRMKALGISVDIDSVNLHLVSKDVMAQQSERDADNHLGLTSSKYEAETRKLIGGSDIYILFGLPRYSFIKVAAHELMHVWMAENRCVKGSRRISEGSCNYASYLVLKKYNHPEAAFEIDGIEENQNAAYGSGFRAVKTFVEENGINYWLEYIKNNKNLPRYTFSR